MPHPIWPFFDLRVATPVLELVGIDDDIGTQLARLAAKGIHDPGFMPFAFPWTDVPSPRLERNTMQFYWRNRAELTPDTWDLNLAVRVNGTVVGSTGMLTRDFPALRRFETGSWLGRDFQGRGLGKEMRIATLQLGFDGFGGQVATTAAYADNAPSLGVTRSLGYTATGIEQKQRRGEPAESHTFEMTREFFTTRLRRSDIRLEGVDACLPLLGLD